MLALPECRLIDLGVTEIRERLARRAGSAVRTA